MRYGMQQGAVNELLNWDVLAASSLRIKEKKYGGNYSSNGG
jgi:hypothetical protein